MLEIYIATIHPQFIAAYSTFGVLRSAAAAGLSRIQALDLRQFAVDQHGSIDARPYGGGDSMVMRPEPLADCLHSLPQKPRVILTSPRGKPFTHQDAGLLATSNEPLFFICGRFAGVDQRFVDRYVDVEYSLGDFVVSGGELPVLLIVDAILRQIPGSLGNALSATNDSFGSGSAGGLEHPVYTRPPVFEGQAVPEVLLSGDHQKIAAWRQDEGRRLTRRLRPELGPKDQSTIS